MVMREFDLIKERLSALLGETFGDVKRAVGVLIAGLVLILMVSLWPVKDQPAEREQLFANCQLTAAELDRIEAVLGASELTGYRVVKDQLHVPRGQRGKYLAAMKEADCLPESFHTPTTAAIQRSGLLEPAGQRRERVKHAREREIELLLIRSIQGVQEAYVRFDETPPAGLRSDRISTVLVGVTTAADRPLEPRRVEMIQQMLLSMRAGLQIENVTIADLTAGYVYRGASSRPAEDSLTPPRHLLELQWARRISKVLSFVPAAEVAVQVDEAPEDRRRPAVRVSVALPTSYVQRLQSTRAEAGDRLTLSQTEQYIREKIQSAIIPLLPAVTSDPQRLVAVNVFDVPEQQSVDRSFWRRYLPLLCGVLVVLGAVLLLRGRRLPNLPGDPEPQLRVFAPEHEDSGKLTAEMDQLQSKLRAYVEEDPDAAAKSLADFIDRAS